MIFLFSFFAAVLWEFVLLLEVSWQLFYGESLEVLFYSVVKFQKPHSVVLRALANHSIPVTLSGEEASINEAILSTVQPFHQVNHL